jgi:hypothetical protein
VSYYLGLLQSNGTEPYVQLAEERVPLSSSSDKRTTCTIV